MFGRLTIEGQEQGARNEEDCMRIDPLLYRCGEYKGQDGFPSYRCIPRRMHHSAPATVLITFLFERSGA